MLFRLLPARKDDFDVMFLQLINKYWQKIGCHYVVTYCSKVYTVGRPKLHARTGNARPKRLKSIFARFTKLPGFDVAGRRTKNTDCLGNDFIPFLCSGVCGCVAQHGIPNQQNARGNGRQGLQESCDHFSIFLAPGWTSEIGTGSVCLDNTLNVV